MTSGAQGGIGERAVRRPRHILVFRFSAMGDVAMLIPVLAAAARANADATFTLVSRERFGHLMRAMPENVAFRGLDLKARPYRGLGGLWRLFRELRALRPTAIADCHDVLRTKVIRTLFRCAGVPVSVLDKGRAAKRRLCAVGARAYADANEEPLPSTMERYARALRAIVPNDFALEPVLRTDVLRPARRIGIAPFAQHAGKIYPVERMEDVVRILSAREGTELFLFGGGPAETAVLASWAAKYPHVACVAGAFSLEGEIDLMATLDVMVSMDSANMHLASLVGTRVVSVWGATHPAAGFLGWGQSVRDCVQRPLSCRPCSVYGNKPCSRGTHPCLDIPPEAIVSAVLDEPPRVG